MKKIISLSLLLMFSTFVFAQQDASADKMLNEAYKKASAEHKNVFVIFDASWCGWCKKLDASMDDNSVKNYFDKNYVVVHFDVQEREEKKNLETPGADVILKKYKGEVAGLPFFLIVDPKGNLLGDSFVNGQNIGCPAAVEEVDAFKGLLKKTSAINEDELNAVTIRFRQNEAAH